MEARHTDSVSERIAELAISMVWEKDPVTASKSSEEERKLKFSVPKSKLKID